MNIETTNSKNRKFRELKSNNSNIGMSMEVFQIPFIRFYKKIEKFEDL